MSFFGLFDEKGTPVTPDTLVKRLSKGKCDWDGLSVDDQDHLKDVWSAGDLRLTKGGVSEQRFLTRCNANAEEMRRDVRKKMSAAFYISPMAFKVGFALADGREVDAELKFRPYSNPLLTDWIESNFRESSRNYGVDDLAKLLTARHFSSREDVADFFEVITFDVKEKPQAPLVDESFQIGSKVFDRYVIQKELGAGGMGRVFLADNRDSKIESRQQVVLKVLRDNLCKDESSRQQFIREADILSSMRHDQIAACYECRFHGSTPVLVMEYIEGVSLDKYLEEHGGALSEQETRQLLRPIAEALDYAHRKKIFHLDVKPLNIIVRTHPKDGFRTCLLDFGISRRAHADGKTTMTSGRICSRQYVSPDYWNEEPLSAAMDVYSLAVTAYECVMGKVPYPYGWKMTGTVDPIASGTPFADAIMRGIEGIPMKRPATCVDLVDPKDVVPLSLDVQQQLDERVTREERQQKEFGKKKIRTLDLEVLSRSFRVYREMLAQSAAKWRDDEERAKWLRDCQAELRDLLKEPEAESESALVRFFTGIGDAMRTAGMTADDIFRAADRLEELRRGLPDDGGPVWRALKDSVS